MFSPRPKPTPEPEKAPTPPAEKPVSREYQGFLQAWHGLLPFKGGLSTAVVLAANEEEAEIELGYLHQLAGEDKNGC